MFLLHPLHCRNNQSVPRMSEDDIKKMLLDLPKLAYLIHNMFVMNMYKNEQFDDKDQQVIDRYQTEEEWQVLAEIE